MRAGQKSLAEAYVRLDGREAWLVGAHIAPTSASYYNHDPVRPRRLLLHRSEIRDLWNSVRQKGVTVIPLKYIKGWISQVEIALAKGKKLYDKRAE